MTPLETELQHLLSLMAPPYRDNWKAYCWAKANALAETDPEFYAGLPQRLKEAMQTDSKPSTPTQPSTDNPRSEK